MQAIEKIVVTNNWITIVLFLLFACIVLLKLLDADRLKESFFAFFSVSLLEEEDFKSSTFFDGFQIVIFLFSVTVFSLVAYSFKAYKLAVIPNDLTSFIAIFAGLLSFFLLKRGLEYLLSVIFLIKSRVRFFLISKNNYMYGASFLLFIAYILWEYSSLNQLYMFYIAAFLFLARFVLYVIRNKKLVFSKLFYFILYLCAFEIAPLFLLFKLIF